MTQTPILVDNQDHSHIENGHAENSPAIVENGDVSIPAKGQTKEEQITENVFQVNINLPHAPYDIQVMVSTQEQVQDLRQSIMESPGTFQYSCFHLESNGDRINDFVELSEVKGLSAGSKLKLVEDPYTEKEARMHLIRVREIIGAAGQKTDTLFGISAGLSLHDNVSPWKDPNVPATSSEKPLNGVTTDKKNALADYAFDGRPSIDTILPPILEQAPCTIKYLGLSAWNPPPPHLRQTGHLLYLQLTTNEGEQYQITSCISGFFVNRSSNNKFDPFPRQAPKKAAAHSLFTLIGILSPSFQKSFEALLDANNKRDPLANFQLTNAIPSSPWLVSPAVTSLTAHQPDLTRTQETYLMSGVENTETLRDWNEEIQSTRELPRETVQDRVFRERLISKIFAEFNEAAARGAVLVARGEIAPLNPTESKDAQIFVYNNVFFSFGADGVGTFTSEGGDEAARVAVGKDVAGVKAVNQLDIPGLATPGTIIVDYLGKRIVAQSIVPGIFKQREPDEHQVDYGGVEGRDVVAENDAFTSTFSQVSKALKVKRHPVWDKDGKKHMLEGSVETKGLLGTDGRKYILDLYRLTPLDVHWLEGTWNEGVDKTSSQDNLDYPHRMTVLRPELVEAYWRLKMGEYVKAEVEKRKQSGSANSHPELSNGVSGGMANGVEDKQDSTVSSEQSAPTDQPVEENGDQERVDISAFSLTLNPDVFSGQLPQTLDEKTEWARDEREVKAVCDFLRQKILPELIHDLKEGEAGFPMDGQSLTQLMHRRGINIRYLGKLCSLAEGQDGRLGALKALAVQEMIGRAFKHLVNLYLKNLPMAFAADCLAHLLNCLLGKGLNKSPRARLDEELQDYYQEADYSFAKATPESMKSEIEYQVRLRYRHELVRDWMDEVPNLQMLRNIALKLGLQLVAKDYQFTNDSQLTNGSSSPLLNGATGKHGMNGHTNRTVDGHNNGHVNGHSGGKKKRKGGRNSPTISIGTAFPHEQSTFSPSDIANLVPVIKDACPKSVLAEEALEAGKISMMQKQNEIGQELLLESLTLHEQIYGILNPEVARVYHQLAMLYYQLDEKSAAIELAHKAVIISERTLGIDSNETILSYLNLALFEHGNRNTTLALSCVRHALDLWKLIYGPKHPDSITTLNNAAVMLQQLQLYKESRQWFEVSLAISEEVSGKQSVNTATLLFQLAQALVLDQDHKGAVHRMREAYSIFLAKLGPEDPNTKESEKWLEQLTSNAVSMAKHAKDVQARRVRRVLFNNPRVGAARPPLPQAGQTSADLASGDSGGAQATRNSRFNDSRSIDELIKFIEGGGDMSKTSPAKKRTTRGNPKRRGRAAGAAI
ncbi:Intracellular distribution of mitochondria [Lecanora helva]